MNPIDFLDGIVARADLDRATPERLAAALDEHFLVEPPADPAAALDLLRDTLAAVDRLAQRAMRLRAGDALAPFPVTRETLTWMASTICTYAGRPSLLVERVTGSLGRNDQNVAAEVGRVVGEVAAQVLDERSRLGGLVLDAAADLARREAPNVRQASRDRLLDDKEKARRRRLAVDLDRVATDPTRIIAAATAARLAALPEPEVEAEPEERPRGRFENLEVD